jgi:uncharacterized repeat protein (TIGR01451 family)
MGIRGLANVVSLSLALLLAACGGGSGRSGTDVVVTGSGPTEEVVAGSALSFTMTVANTGANAASDIKLLNLVGNQVVLNSITCTASGGATCPDTSSPSMSVPNLPAGGVLVFPVAATASQSANGTLTNTLSATYDADADHSNNAATVLATARGFNLVVSSEPPTGDFAGGSPAVFTATITNEGPSEARDVAITDTPSEGLTLGSINCTASGGAVCPVVTSANMVAPSIPSGGSLSLSIATTITAGSNGLVNNAVAVAAAGDAKSFDDADAAVLSVTSSDLGVSQSGPATLGAGGTAVFTAVVANAGSGSATGLAITHNLTAGFSATITCAASTGASCPAVVGPSMSVPELQRGGKLTFNISVPVGDAFRGALTSTMVVAALGGDSNAADNTATVTTAVVDARNGAYKAVASDGREYDLSIDFDAHQASFSRSGTTWQRSFSGPDSSGDFVIEGTSRFRIAADLVVGSHDFGDAGGKPVAFVAGRSFATSILQATGTYNVATLDVGTSAAATTHAGTAQVSDNTLFVCQSDTAVTRPSSCDPAAMKSYTLQIDAASGTFIGSAVGNPNEKYIFRIARTGASTVLLSASEASDGSRRFRVGLPESSALAGGTQRGPDTSGDWVQMSLTGSSVSTAGVNGTNNLATVTLQTVSNGGPFAMRVGQRSTDSAKVYALQALPMAVLVGGYNEGASGLLLLTLP